MTQDKRKTGGEGVDSDAASDLTDTRGGAEDSAMPGRAPADTPEGLRRERKGPYGPDSGRRGHD